MHLILCLNVYIRNYLISKLLSLKLLFVQYLMISYLTLALNVMKKASHVLYCYGCVTTCKVTLGGLLMAFCRPNVGSLRTGDGLPSASRPTASLRDVLRWETHWSASDKSARMCPTASSNERLRLASTLKLDTPSPFGSGRRSTFTIPHPTQKRKLTILYSSSKLFRKLIKKTCSIISVVFTQVIISLKCYVVVRL